MRKRILALITVVTLATITAGCEDTYSATKEEKTLKEHTDESIFGNEEVDFYVDPETGAEYLIFKFGSGDNKQWEVVPRYNPDGSIKALD